MTDSRDRTLRRTPSYPGIGAPRATADYRAAEQAVRDRTAKLREARLARETADKGK